MIWHVSSYWLDMWHNTDVTNDINNFQKKITKIKIKKNEKLTCDTSLTPLTLY